MAGYTLQTTVVNGVTYVVGYDAKPTGDDLPPLLLVDNQWYDVYGNPRFLLNPDGTVVYANIAPTAQQIADKQTSDLVDKATTKFIRLLVQEVKGNATAAACWAALYNDLKALLT